MNYKIFYILFFLLTFYIFNGNRKIYENLENMSLIMIENSGLPNMKFAKLHCNSGNPLTNKSANQTSCIKVLKNKKLKIINLFPKNNKSEGDVNYKIFFKTTNTSDLPKLMEFKSWYSENTSSGTFKLPAGKTKYVKFPYTGIYTFQNNENPGVFGSNATGIKSSFQIMSE